MSDTAQGLIAAWVGRQAPADGMRWLEERLGAVREDPSTRTIAIALGFVPRKLGRADLALSAADFEAADTARPGWTPRDWSVDNAARVLLLLAYAESIGASRDREWAAEFVATLTDLVRTADAAESVAYFRGLPLYPAADLLRDLSGEGLRTNMRIVFEAVAHHSPFPREQFDRQRWNQMVLKAIFIGSTLAPIQGLDERANEELAEILIDYAHERWAAGRLVTPELWRCVGPFATGRMLDDLARPFASTLAVERRAAALALAASPDPEARRMLADAPDLADAIGRGALTWTTLEPGLGREKEKTA